MPTAKNSMATKRHTSLKTAKTASASKKVAGKTARIPKKSTSPAPVNQVVPAGSRSASPRRIIDWLHDSRTDCYSAMATLTVRDYLALVQHAHAQRGAIEGQREVLKTTTARRIRERMIADIQAGALLPPVVIGLVVDDQTYALCGASRLDLQADFLDAVRNHPLSIIDGMQRTASLMDAALSDSSVKNRLMRVEFWVAKSARSMIYRMLVLNTGQVPWNLARQLTVVYAPLLHEVEQRASNVVKIIKPDDKKRRAAAGQYASNDLVELYLAFSLRKMNIDARESLSEEFSRLDLVENVSNSGFQDLFYTMLSTMGELDVAFERSGKSGFRFGSGKAIFGSQPARIGYTVAIAMATLGRPGSDTSPADRQRQMGMIVKHANALAKRLAKLDSDGVDQFLKLDMLSELLDTIGKVGQVGRHERNFFFEAFKVLVDEKFKVQTMEPCWRAS